MHRVFKTRSFARWSRKAPISDIALCRAVAEMVAGLVDADLGGGVYKKRVAMPGRGKSGGARTILGTNFGNRWFYIFGFEKSERSNIDAKELAVLQLLSKALVNMDIEALDRAIEAGELTEICHEKESTA